MSSKEGNRKEKTPSKRGGKKQGKGKDNRDTGVGDAGDSGDENATKEELQDLQTQQEEQCNEIKTLKIQLTAMQGQLEEARNGNAEMKAMLVQLINASKVATNSPEEGDTSSSGTRSEEPDNSNSDSGGETEETDDDEMLADANMRKQISYSFSDYQKQLDTVEPSKRNCPIRKKSHMEWMINLNKNMTAIGMGKIVHEKREKWLRYRVSKKRERRENAQLQEHVIKRVLNTYVTAIRLRYQTM